MDNSGVRATTGGSAQQVRLRARAGALTTSTAGLAHGYVQANLVILPEALASDFLRFCQLNPKSCPLLDVSEPGSNRFPKLGTDLDIRTDLPRYRVWRDGELVAEPTDVEQYWRSDLVSFAIGCSFTFEAALIDSGIALRHVDRNHNVAMYRTNLPSVPAGIFEGPTVVSMRPLRPADAIRAIQVSGRFPSMHGAPLHFGDPSQIGIADLSRPDYGDPVEIAPGEVPVFWACGVTPQAVLATVRPSFAITHAPGCMLLTDRCNSQYAVS